MKKKIAILCAAVLTVAALSACSIPGLDKTAPMPEPTAPQATPEPTPEPTPIIPLGSEHYWGDENELDLTGTGATAQELVDTLRRFSGLESVTISDCDYTPDEQVEIMETYPEIAFMWPVNVLGTAVENTAEVLDLADLGVDITELGAYAPCLPNVHTIDLGSDFHTIQEILDLKASFNNVGVICATEYNGTEFMTNQREVNLTYGYFNSLDELNTMITALCGTQKLIMPFNSYMTNDELVAYTNSHDDIRIVWHVKFLDWDVRSDVTCFSTLQAEPFSKTFTSYDFSPLFNYCTDLVALDMGHNNIVDLTEITNLKKLKYLILADNQFMLDVTPLGELTELEYLELFRIGWITDYSSFNNLHKMVDINISYSQNLRDISFLDQMPDLKMVWLRDCTGIPDEQKEAAVAAHPDAEFLFKMAGEESSTCGGWRATERNIALRTAFKYWYLIDEFVSWDNYTFREGAEYIPAVAEWD